jgi:probable HAF family extracellular repeat protein
MTDLGTLDGVGASGAQGISPAGQVVGWSWTTDPRTENCCHAFLWEKGVMTFLGTLGGTNSLANAINPKGRVVGYSTTTGDASLHAFLWEKGVLTDLGTLPGGSFSIANAINPAGQVVGYGDVAGASHAIVRSTTHRCRPSFSLDSMPLRAMRCLMCRRRHASRQRR